MRRALPLLLLLLGWTAGAESSRFEVEGEGSARIVGGNIVSARRRALNAARRDAVARAVAERLGEERLAAVEPQLARNVYPRHGMYVRRYRVLEERQDSRQFHLRVAVVLDRKRLARDLRRLLSERSSGSSDASAAGGARGVVVGVRVERTGSASGESGGGLLRKRVTEGLRGSGFLVRGTGAEVQILVQISSTSTDGVRGLEVHGARSRAEVRAVGARGEQRLATGSAVTVGFGATVTGARQMAARRALEQALTPVLRVLEQRYPMGRGQRGSWSVWISGIDSSARFREVRRTLAERVTIIRRVRPRQVTVSAAGFLVETAPDLGAGDVASALTRHVYPGFSLRVERIEGGAIWLQLTTHSDSEL